MKKYLTRSRIAIICILITFLVRLFFCVRYQCMIGDIQMANVESTQSAFFPALSKDVNYPRVIYNRSGMYMLRNTISNGVLAPISKRWEIISDGVNDVVCTDKGVVYLTEDDILFFYQNGATVRIADDVDTMCWDGQSLIYHRMSDGAVLRWDGMDHFEVTCIPADVRCKIVSDGYYLAVIARNGDRYLYCIPTQELITIASYGHNLDDYYFIVDHYLIGIGSFLGGCEVFDLENGTFTQVDLGWNGHGRITTVTVLVQGEYIYISIECGTVGMDNLLTGTYRLKTGNWEVAIIDANFYPVLYRKDGYLIGTDLFSVCKLAELE